MSFRNRLPIALFIVSPLVSVSLELDMLSTGNSPSCPCIDSSEILKAYSNCILDDTGDPGIRYHEVCLPLTFGASQCAPHDVGLDPRCPFPNATRKEGDAPEFCGEQWCYVDFQACRLAPEQIYRSKAFEADHPALDLFYSYSVCNASADSFLSYV